MKPRPLVALVLGVIVCITTLSWATRAGFSDRVVYESAVVQSLDEMPSIVVPATIKKDRVLPLFAREDGVVTSVKVQPGDRVRAGQLLAALDVSEADLKLFQALEKLDSSEGVTNFADIFDGVSRLQSSGYYNAFEAEDARSQVLKRAQDRAQFSAVFSSLRARTVGKILRAPFDGVVDQVSWQVGDLISAARQMNPGVTVSPTVGGFVAQLDIDEDAVRILQVGSPVRVQLPGAEKDLGGKLVSISTSPILAEKTRFYRGYATLDGAPAVVDGLRASVEVRPTTDPDVVWIPREAIDLKIPDSLVAETVSYIRASSLTRTTTEKANEKESFAVRGPSKTKSAAGRSVASDVAPLETDQREIYLLTSADRVIRARVAVEAKGDAYTQVRGKELAGARVITNFHYERQSIRKLLGGR